jgi:hypothetical protein
MTPDEISREINGAIAALREAGRGAAVVKITIMAAHRVSGRTGDNVTEGAALVAVDCALDAARYALDGEIEMAIKHAIVALQAARDAGGEDEIVEQVRDLREIRRGGM